MKMRILAAYALLTLPLSGCGSEPEQPELVPRLDEMSRNHASLEVRVSKLEEAAQAPEEQAAQSLEERSAQAHDKRLESLRAGQRLIEQNQKMLCDATGDC